MVLKETSRTSIIFVVMWSESSQFDIFKIKFNKDILF